ncbi:MAG: hypothetical protein H7249_20765 [Chitinophagaceae bacterium]|nr:hypothetical protein [Oligoflexus sp.]
MRTLTRTLALLAVTGCMSNHGRAPKRGTPAAAERPVAPSSIDEVQAQSPSPALASSNAGAALVSTPSPSQAPVRPVMEAVNVPAKSPCDAAKKDVSLPVFIKETSTLVVGLDQKCRDKEATSKPSLLANMSVIGVACTGAPGLITRRGHSTQNWELVTFGMDLGCNMRSAEDVKNVGKKKFGFETDPRIISFVPMMIEYWEFEKNNDAGLSSTPTLTAAGGGAAQWKKNETKSTGFPIKLYGHSSTIGKDQSVYEARAVLLPRSNQRQFEVHVEEMKLLGPDELKVALDHCLAKTNAKPGCNEAFDTK